MSKLQTAYTLPLDILICISKNMVILLYDLNILITHKKFNIDL